MAPAEAADKVRLLMSFAPELGVRDVPDPYYGDAADFDRALDLIERAAAGLLAALKRDLA